jgi:hypothetical protein
MYTTYHLVQLPPTLLFFIITGIGAVFAGLGTYLVRKYIKIKILRSHNEVTGFLFLAIASFYAMLLDIEHMHLHVGLNALLGVIIGMLLFVIILLGHPFTGSLGLKPKSYEQIFIQEHWTNDLAPVEQ